MFSVVIPLYNKAHTIAATLNSVLLQTFTEFEVIIINDGSTDDGIDVIKKFTQDPRIHIYNQNNQGVSAARNKGVALSKYDYIAFLDGDDEWVPNFLGKIKDAIELYPKAGMYGTSSWHVNILTGEKKESTLKKYKNKIKIVDYFDNPHHMPHTSAMVISKESFNNIFKDGNGFPIGMKCCEDFACFYRIALRVPFVYIGFPLGIRNSGVPGQITNSGNEIRFQLLKHVMDFYNISFTSYHELNKKHNLYDIFFKYDIRNRFISHLRINDYRSITYILNHSGELIINQFSNVELSMYRDPKYRWISILYIYYTKIIFKFSKYLTSYQLS